MCDYSLHAVPNRLAVEGEELVTFRFPTSSIGLASPADLEKANCQVNTTGVGRSWWSVLKSWLNPPPLRIESPPNQDHRNPCRANSTSPVSSCLRMPSGLNSASGSGSISFLRVSACSRNGFS